MTDWTIEATTTQVLQLNIFIYMNTDHDYTRDSKSLEGLNKEKKYLF